MSSLNPTDPSHLMTASNASGSQFDLQMPPTTSEGVPRRSPIEWFLNAFLQQQNIKWLAVIGAAIVIASSLMLVSREWSNWHESIKFLVILGYTGLIYGFSEFGRKSLGLQVTSRVLQLLTVLLLPMTFMALGWFFQAKSDSGLPLFSTALLALPALALTWFAANRIFEELWRGKQTTYLVCYVTLSLLGILPGVPASKPMLAIGLVFVYWVIATVGSVKMNRHIFWMSEKNRLPRAFGFLPMTLLGLQFIALASIKAGSSIPWEWIGVIFVLAASTLLLATRELSIVHRQRTGGLLHPMPWILIVPILMSISLAILGVLLGVQGFCLNPVAGRALVLSSVLASMLLFMIANETQRKMFVWGGLLLILVAYQVSPTLIHGFLSMVRDHAASAVGEARLPIGFYGLSYLPLLIVLASIGAMLDRRHRTLFADPIRHLVTMLTLVLGLLSLMHLKSLFMVACVNMIWFPILACMFRDRRYMLFAMISATLVAGGWPLFLQEMGLIHVSNIWGLVSCALLASFLGLSTQADRIVRRIPQRSEGTWGLKTASQGHELQWARVYAAMLTLATLTVWILLWMAHFSISAPAHGIDWYQRPMAIPAYLAIGILLTNIAYSSIRFRSYLGSLFGWVLLGFVVGQGIVFETHWTWEWTLDRVVPILIGMTIVGKWILRGEARPSGSYDAIQKRAWNFLYQDSVRRDGEPASGDTTSIPAAVLFPMVDLCYVVLASWMMLIVLPWVLVAHLGSELELAWSTTAIFGALLIDCLVFRNRVSAVVFAILSPIATSGMLIHTKLLPASLEVVLSAWLIVLTVNYVLFRKSPGMRVAAMVSQLGLVATLLLSLTSLGWSVRLAGLSGAFVLAWLERDRIQKYRIQRYQLAILAIIANIQSILLVARCFVPSWQVWIDSVWSSPMLNSAMMAALAVSVHLWSAYGVRLNAAIGTAWRTWLRIAFVGIMVVSMLGNTHVPFGMVACLFGMTVGMIVEIAEAIRRQKEGHVWCSFLLAGIASTWVILESQNHLAYLQVQSLLLGLSMIGIALIAFLRRHSRLAILANPLHCIAVASPGIVCLLSLARFVQQDFVVTAWESLMLFAAAAIYFHSAIQSRKAGYWIAAASILNIGLVVLWVSLRVNDPQFYMVPIGLTLIGLVELLKQEVPQALRNPIRYFGATVILVSPMWEIVGGSWLHLFTLLLLSLLVICLAIGLRIKALVYTGSGFLMIDLVSMVVHSAVAHPGLLWVGGLATGVGVITLAAVCENKREQLLSRMRLLSAELAAWN